MDRRQRKTREAIFAAFSTLLSSKSYAKITIQEIIDRANVGRSTFYSHFETKDDLLREMCTELFDHVFSEHLDMENTHDFSLANGDPASLITHILYHLRDNKRNVVGILSCESGELFLRFFRQYLNELITRHLLAGVKRRNPVAPEDVLVNHIAGSFVGMVQWWITTDMRQSPEELAKCFLSVTLPVL